MKHTHRHRHTSCKAWTKANWIHMKQYRIVIAGTPSQQQQHQQPPYIYLLYSVIFLTVGKYECSCISLKCGKIIETIGQLRWQDMPVPSQFDVFSPFLSLSLPVCLSWGSWLILLLAHLQIPLSIQAKIYFQYNLFVHIQCTASRL